MIPARDPRSDAQAVLAEGFEPRVLEPSLPVVVDPEHMADDPTDPSGAIGTVVSPAGDGDLSWDEYLASHPEVSAYARDHWLGDLARLEPLPDGFVETRNSLHQVAYFVVAPRRYEVTGKLGLRYTHGGFGTPFFGLEEQVRVQDGVLVRQVAEEVATHTLTTLEAASDFVGIDYRQQWFEGFHDPLQPLDPSSALAVDPAAARSLGDWFGFASHVLERARRTPGAVDVSRVQLWPEHFDPAFEMGSNAMGQRASFGASPGDASNEEPYLYVAPWGQIDHSNRAWNAESFEGAFLPYSALLEVDDQVAVGMRFFRSRYAALTS